MICADAIPNVKPKQQRLILAVVALVAVIGAGLLATLALRDQAAYFFTPAEAKAATITPGEEVRLGGVVERGSIERQTDGLTIAFRLTDGTAVVPVRYTGIVPDLFAEGSGAVADGRFRADGTFVADRILAKHDERYMAPQMDHIPLNAGDTVVEGDAA
jgi:cytochrome c-type biogenesis protein CcmE